MEYVLTSPPAPLLKGEKGVEEDKLKKLINIVL